jgi:hypothetical protein
MITGGSSINFDTKRQKRDHYRSINHIAITGPVVQTKWSYVIDLRRQRRRPVQRTPHRRHGYQLQRGRMGPAQSLS